MVRKLAINMVMVVVVLLAFMVGKGDCGLLGNTTFGISHNLISSQEERDKAAGTLQFEVLHQNRLIWSGDKLEDAGFIFPSLPGLVVRVYPNVLSDGNAIVAMAVSEGELEKKLTWRRDRKTGVYQFDELICLERDPKTRRYYLDIPLERAGDGIHAMRFYALTEDARRNQTKLNLILFKVKWGSSSPEPSLAEVFRFRTESWPEKYPTPTPEYLVGLLRRAGTGGSGMVFATLLAQDAQFGVMGASERYVSSTGYDGGDRIGRLEKIVDNHADSIDALAKNQKKIAEQVDKNTQDIADLQVKVGNIEDWARECSDGSDCRESTSTNPESRPSKKEMVRFRVAFVRSEQEKLRIEDDLRGLPLVPVEIKTSRGIGYLKDGVAEYLKEGIPRGARVALTYRRSGGKWQNISFTVTPALDCKVLVVPARL